MKKTNMTSEIREYTMNADNPIVIPRNLLEEAGINPYAWTIVNKVDTFLKKNIREQSLCLFPE